MQQVLCDSACLGTGSKGHTAAVRARVRPPGVQVGRERVVLHGPPPGGVRQRPPWSARHCAAQCVGIRGAADGGHSAAPRCGWGGRAGRAGAQVGFVEGSVCVDAAAGGGVCTAGRCMHARVCTCLHTHHVRVCTRLRVACIGCLRLQEPGALMTEWAAFPRMPSISTMPAGSAGHSHACGWRCCSTRACVRALTSCLPLLSARRRRLGHCRLRGAVRQHDAGG